MKNLGGPASSKTGEKLPERGARNMAPEVGFEPTTNRLTADRSTTEIRMT